MTAAETQTVRDALAGYGLDLRNQFQDDHQALQHLVVMARQAQEQRQLAQYGNVYLQHANEFQQWMAERQRQAQQQAQQQQQSWWKAPEYDPTWQQKLMRDPTTGELRPVPGADPTLVQKYMAWVEHQRNFLDKFAQDPIGSIKPGIEQIVQQTAQNLIQQQFGQFQERTAANQFVQQNSDWLHVRDERGNVVTDPRTGGPALSTLGQRFAGYVVEAERMGLMDTASQERYALGLLQRDFLMAQSQQAMAQRQQQPQQQPMSPGDDAKAQFLQQAGMQAQQAQPTPVVGNTNGSYRQPNGLNQRGLQEMLAKELAAAGYSPGAQLT